MSYRGASEFALGPPPALRPGQQRKIGPVTFEVMDRQAAVNDIKAAVDARSSRVFAFCNMHTFNTARRLPSLAAALAQATVFNDGLGIDIASNIIFGSKFPENLNGTDLTPALLDSFERQVSVFLVGSPPGVAQEAAEALARAHPLVRIVGTRHGFFTDAESDPLVTEIRAAHADLLLVGMGNPRQELWASQVAASSGAVVLCVGAYFDFVAGRVARAPLWVRQARCEWLYRMALEPSRLWRRYIGGAGPFLYSVLAEKRSQRRLPMARPQDPSSQEQPLNEDPRHRNQRFDHSSLGAFLTDYANTLRSALLTVDTHALDRARAVIEEAAAKGKRIFAIGNGGSSAIADHLCCDLTKGTHGGGHPIIDSSSMTSNMALYSAIANDYGFDKVFSTQIAFVGRPGDVLIAISSSGKSPNILRAVSTANELGISVIGLSGFDGGALREAAHVDLHVAVKNYGIVEDAHQALMHVLAQYITAHRDLASPLGGRSATKEFAT